METIDIIVKMINELKDKNGTKQKFIAQKCGFDEKDFSRLLNKKRIVTAKDIERLSGGLNKEPNDFFEINRMTKKPHSAVDNSLAIPVAKPQ